MANQRWLLLLAFVGAWCPSASSSSDLHVTPDGFFQTEWLPVASDDTFERHDPLGLVTSSFKCLHPATGENVTMTAADMRRRRLDVVEDVKSCFEKVGFVVSTGPAAYNLIKAYASEVPNDESRCHAYLRATPSHQQHLLHRPLLPPEHCQYAFWAYMQMNGRRYNSMYVWNLEHTASHPDTSRDNTANMAAGLENTCFIWNRQTTLHYTWSVCGHQVTGLSQHAGTIMLTSSFVRKFYEYHQMVHYQSPHHEEGVSSDKGSGMICFPQKDLQRCEAVDVDRITFESAKKQAECIWGLSYSKWSDMGNHCKTKSHFSKSVDRVAPWWWLDNYLSY